MTTSKEDNAPAVERTEADAKLTKPEDKHFPVTESEIEAWLGRVDEITTAVKEYVLQDPEDAERQAKDRDAARKRDRDERLRKTMKERYDPQYYRRFENDVLINKLLEEADKPAKKPHETDAVQYLSDFEKVVLREATRVKEEANTAYKQGDWKRALDSYDTAIGMNPKDEVLLISLYNNRSMVQLKLMKYVACIEDASHVLQKEPRNHKALLRRATALVALHRPVDAKRDVECALLGDSTSLEAIGLMAKVNREKADIDAMEVLLTEHPDAAAELGRVAKELVGKSRDFVEAVTSKAPELEQKAYPLTTSVCAVGTFVEQAGCSAFFRVHGGVSACEGLLVALQAIDGVEPPLLFSKPCFVVLLASVLRVLASCYAAPVAHMTYGDNLGDSHPLAFVCGRCINTTVMMVVIPALQYLQSVCACEVVRARVAKDLPLTRVSDLMMPSEVSRAAAMNFLEVFLREEHLKAEFLTNDKWNSTVLHYVLSGSTTVEQEAAARLLFRLGVDRVGVKIGDVVSTLGRSLNCSVVTSEALLALLYNAALDASRRPEIARCVVQEQIAAPWWLLAKASPASGIAARGCALCAKCVGLSDELSAFFVDVCDELITGFIVSKAPRPDVETVESAENSREGATAILAIIGHQPAHAAQVRGVVLKHLPSLLPLTQSLEDKTTSGNAALIIGDVATADPGAVVRAGGVQRLLDALKATRGRLDAMEHDGLRDTPIWMHRKSALKNIAIALSRCSKDALGMTHMRELRATEILAACMEAQ